MIVGEGMNRDCCDCHIRLGCDQPTGERLDCDNCETGICPDTDDISHGLCTVCLARALAKEKKR